MQIVTGRFGRLEVSPEEVFFFPEGLLGFEQLRNYIFVEVQGNPAFKWLQSLEDAEVAFLLVDPFLFVPGYEVNLGEGVEQKLKIGKREEVLVYTTVTIPRDRGVEEATTNLLGPIIVNIRKRLGLQLVLENTVFKTKYKLFSSKKPCQAAGGS